MTQGPHTLWRDDEGAGKPLPVAPGAPRGHSPSELLDTSAHQGPIGNIWREDEGRPTVPTRLRQPDPVPSQRRRTRKVSEPSPRRFSWPLVVATTLVLLIMVVLADALWAGFRLRASLTNAVGHLEMVEESLSQGDLASARARSDDAIQATGAAQDATDRPSLVLASLIPEVNRETRAVNSAVEAAELSARAAASLVDGAFTLGLDEEGVPDAIYTDGQVQLDTMAAARQELNAAELLLVEAAVTLEGLNPRLPQLQTAAAEASDQIATALQRATETRTLFDLLPPLLGRDDDRTYLLAFQAPGEARGTGGLIGLAATLEAKDGRLEMGKTFPYTDISGAIKKAVAAPEWFETSYGGQGALTEWPQANISPNFPVVSEVLLGMYESSAGEQLDGVISMDPIALANLMEGMAPIETRNPRMSIDSSNVARLLMVDSYTDFDSPEKQNAFLEQIVDGFWSRVSGGDVDLEAFSEGFAEAIRTQRVKIYSATNREQTQIQELDLDGNYDSAGPTTQMAFNINYAANKVDYYLEREIRTDIDLQSDGSAKVTTVVNLANHAPSGPASPLLGENNGLKPGVNRMTMNVLMPPGSVIDRFEVGGEERAPFTYLDATAPVAWDLLEIDPGAEETLEITYSVPGAIQILGDDTVFDFVLFPQTTVNSDAYSLSISPPPGVRVTDGPKVTPRGELEMSGTLEAPVSVRMQMEPE